MAKTLTTYFSNDKDILSFAANTEVKVFSRSAGVRKDLWGVEIFGKRGYAPKNLIREYSILKSKLLFEVPTESSEENVPKKEIPEEKTTNDDKITEENELKEETSEESSEKPAESVINSSANDLEHTVPIPENVSPSYEVIDGTTIPLIIDEPPSDYVTQVEDAPVEEEPILSVHPSLVSSTISFVSQVIDKVTQQLEKKDEPEKELLKEEEIKDDAKDELEEKEKEDVSQSQDENVPKVEGENVLKVEDESVSKGEDENISKGEDENVLNVQEEIDPKVQDENIPNVQEERVTNFEDENVLNVQEENAPKVQEENVPSSQVENLPSTEGENLPNSENENKEVAEEKGMKEEKITEEPKKEGINSEEIKKKVENDDDEDDEDEDEEEQAEIQEKEKEEISPKKEIPEEKPEISEKIETQETKDSKIVDNDESKFVDDSPVEKVSEVPLSNLSTNEIVTDQVPLIDTRETFILREKNDENLVSDNENITIDDQIPKIETNSSIFDDENVNIVDSENILIENASDSNFEIYKKDDFSQINSMGMKDGSIETREFSSETIDVSVDKNDFSRNNDSGENIPKHEDVLNIISQGNGFISRNDNLENLEPHFHDDVEPRKQILAAEQTSTFNELPSNRNLLNIDETHYHSQESQSDKSSENEIPEPENLEKFVIFDKDSEDEPTSPLVLPPEVCEKDSNCPTENVDYKDDNAITQVINMGKNYWEFLAYLLITSVTILVFSLGYYYIENARRDNQLIGKINKLEKELMISSKECAVLNDNLTCAKTKLNSIEDESFGSNEMVASLKEDLAAAQSANLEMEDQVASLEKELETATEAGLELERMLRELLSSNKEDNPLAQSIEDLQARLNVQQAENEALTNALNLKKQEADGLSSELLTFTKKYEELEVEVKRLEEDLKTQGSMKIYMEQSMEDKIQRLEFQMRETMEERSQLRQALKAKELEINHLLEVVDQDNSNNLDFDKLYDSVQAKAEALQLAEERDELQVKLKEAEIDHRSLEALMKSTKEEVISLTEECKAFEKEKRDAETKLEVLSNFFKEKEAQRQKEEAVWLEKQGEVASTVERIHTMQNEIQNYKQQIEILKREIVDQEREYKSQIGALETKAHEHWVVARQNERRLEELKAESGQLRNRLTIVEKSMNDPDPEVKLHRMEANGETATSPSLFLGPDSSNSPIMFSNTSGVPPPPPPSYMFGPGFHPYLPPPPPGPGGLPPFDVGQRPPPLGGRLSSPPPLPLQPPSGRYENTGSPPPLSPPLPHHHFGRHRSPPPPPHFSNDHIHSHHPPPPSLLPIHSLGHSHNWGEESLPPLRNSGFYPHQREQRSRNHKGSLHSSGESLDKSHHSGKV